jgi:hypothetical protein
VVRLRGLDIDGLGKGANGIVFNSGGSLTVIDCVVRRFVGAVSDYGNGIKLSPSSGSSKIVIENSTFSDNQQTGVVFSGTSQSTASASIVVSGAVLLNNNYGMYVNLANNTSGTVNVAISNTTASNNTDTGLGFNGRSPSIVNSFVDSSTIENNGQYGLLNLDQSVVLLSNNVVALNKWGVSSKNSTIYSIGDNRIGLNSVADVDGAMLRSLSLR